MQTRLELKEFVRGIRENPTYGKLTADMVTLTKQKYPTLRGLLAESRLRHYKADAYLRVIRPHVTEGYGDPSFLIWATFADAVLDADMQVTEESVSAFQTLPIDEQVSLYGSILSVAEEVDKKLPPAERSFWRSYQLEAEDILRRPGAVTPINEPEFPLEFIKRLAIVVKVGVPTDGLNLFEHFFGNSMEVVVIGRVPVFEHYLKHTETERLAGALFVMHVWDERLDVIYTLTEAIHRIKE